MLRKNIALLFFIICTCCIQAWAGWQPLITNRIGSVGGSGSALATSGSVRSYDNNFASTIHSNPSLYTDNKVINRIVLGIDRDRVSSLTGFTVNASYQFEVDVLIEYLNSSQASTWITSSTGHVLGSGTCVPCSTTTVSQTLRVNYDPNYQTTETELGIYTFADGYDVKVTITQMRLNSSVVTTAPNNVYLENTIAIERYRELDLSTSTSLTFAAGPITGPPPILEDEGQITINTAIPGAESYDIEWMYLDWYSGDFQALNINRFAFDFKNNATRVTTKSTSYKIPIIYPKGVLLFRVRANGVSLTDINKLISTQWYGASSGVIDVNQSTGAISAVTPTPTVYGYYTAGFSNGLTWQYSTSFAEEGKKKQVISYYDGSLYNRQSITRTSSDTVAIVGQTVYDFNGRPAVQILPAPVPSTNIQDHDLLFKPNYNQTNDGSRSGETYNYKDFDVDADNCTETRTASLSDNSGTEQYYSASNPILPDKLINKNLIPDAQGYAFTQTEFTPDNTGRVRRQGGVGPAHRLTGDDETGTAKAGKETKYYYGVPNQFELDQLFASEAGDANRYKKNIVIDPNGQVSISYIDPMGRVVATALAGHPDNSANMLPVDGRNPQTITIDVIERNTKNFPELKITSDYDQMVYTTGAVQKFWYRLAIPMLNYQCGGHTFCYDCKYDLNISIVDDCGNEYVPTEYRSNKVGMVEGDHTCGDSIIFETDGYFQLTLNQGTYKIRRTLTIDQAALEQYIQDLLANTDVLEDCLTPYADLLADEKSNLDYTHCEYTCATCTTDASALYSASKITLAEYNDMMQACSAFCYQSTPCDALYQQMLIDMSPGGQYFDNQRTTGDYFLNVEGGILESLMLTPPDNDMLNYLDGGFSYFFDGVGGPGDLNDILIAKGITGLSITTWDDVRKYWDDDFAKKLVEMHPEYCLWQKCSTINNSYIYDAAMLNTATAADAIANKYYNPTDMSVTGVLASPNTTNRDPFFYGGPGNLTNMNSSLSNYQTISSTNYNAWQFVDYVVTQQGSDISGCLTDYGWNLFRAIYRAKKQAQLEAYYNANCTITFNFDDFEADRRFPYKQTDINNLVDATFGTSVPGSGSSETTFKTFVNGQIADNCNKACSAYIDQWKFELSGCGLSTDSLNAVIARMLAVCKAGCDENDPLGSRYSKPSVTVECHSFREALKTHYNAGICDDLLVSWPRGNYHDYWAENTPYVNRCGCLPNQQAPDPAPACTDCESETLTPNGKHIFQNMQMAGEKKCKNCITCVNLAGALSELDKMYSTTFVADDDNKRRIMENYFNLRFSFNLTYLEYLDFMRDCAGETSLSSTTIADFRTALSEYIDPQPIVHAGDEMGFMAMEGGDSLSEEFPVDSMGLDSFGGGFETMSYTAPPGYSPLDKCGCDRLLAAKVAFDALAIKPPGCTTFKDYVNHCSGNCEGQWGSLDVDYIWQACKDAVDKDLDNPYSGSGFTWKDEQLAELDDYITFNLETSTPKLIIPANCDCTTPPEYNPDADEETDDCDACLQAALLKALQADAANLKINGVSKTPTEMYDYLTKPVLKEVKTNYDAGTNTYSYTYVYSSCMFMYPWTNPDYFYDADGWTGLHWNALFIQFAHADGCFPAPTGGVWPTRGGPCWGCGGGGGVGGWEPSDDWPFADPPTFCHTCYKPNTELLTQTLGFLNQLTAPYNGSRLQAGNILTSSGWMIDPTADEYIGDPLYSGSCGTSLKYKVVARRNGYKFTPGQPSSLTFTVSDASGGGSCTHNAEWTITFPEANDDYRFTYITEFTEILAPPRNCTDLPSGFWVAATVAKPDGTSTEVKYLYVNVSFITSSSVTPYQSYVENPDICKKLCNKPILPDAVADDPCTDFLDRVAETNAARRYEQQIEDLRQEFTNQYVAKCMSAFDYLRMEYTEDVYHFTLYYYDQADNLIKTVPPKGVKVLGNTALDSVVKHRAGISGYSAQIIPNHNYITNYKYNTLNQLAEQTTPDAGVSKFWYDRMGRIVLSQNAKQAAYTGGSGQKRYSYTQYDRLGRISEAGEIEFTSTVAATVNPANTADNNPSGWVATNIVACTTKTQITRTYYDREQTWMPAISGFTRSNLRNRVVATCYYDAWQANNEDYNHATWYSYDVLGNVHHLVQDIPTLADMQQQYKHIKYNYDLASGNVNLVSYQPGEADQFFHYYQYDADNRITKVYTSRNPAVSPISPDGLSVTLSVVEGPGMGWQVDAKYMYYLHGPLARMELGNNKVQGTDYSYTLHGWLKAVNAGLMRDVNDPGLDGNIPALGTNLNRWTGRDVVGLELGYYHSNAALVYDDYTPIGTTTHISDKTGSNFLETQVNLYNGNINNTLVTIPDKTQIGSGIVQAAPLGTNYEYDQLNRLRNSINYTNANTGTNTWQSTFTTGYKPQHLQMKLTYDPMGNINSLIRHAATASTVAMDSLAYSYNNSQWTNQLTHVDDIISAGAHTEDIDDQSSGNYTYDEIGNLTGDAAEEIQDIEWTVYGKIKRITRTGASNTKADLEFEYNTAGQRVKKKVIPVGVTPYLDDNWYDTITTYYVRDASGNIMATYEHKYSYDPDLAIASENFTVKEWDLYGSSRLGVINGDFDPARIMASRDGVFNSGGQYEPNQPEYTVYELSDYVIDGSTNQLVGTKNYELTNHLGNVLVTITDRKVPNISGSSFTYFNAQVTTVTDYYPFGQQIEERSWVAANNKYRFGFNGKESDNEVSGQGNQYDYGFRIYNPRIGKFLSVDPLTQKYPWYTPYQFAGNNPIWFIDLDGLEPTFSEMQNEIVRQKYEKKYEEGKITFEELKNSQFRLMGATALGYGLGGYAALEIFVTRGKITQHLARQYLIIYGTNLATNILMNGNKSNAEIMKESLEGVDLADAVFSLAGDKTLGSKIFGILLSSSFDLTLEGAKNVVDGSKTPEDMAVDACMDAIFSGEANTNWSSGTDELVDKLLIPFVQEGLKKILKNDIAQVTGEGVRLRSSPTTENNSNILCYTSKGDKLLKTGNINNSFYEVIDKDGNKGWISSQYLKCQDETN